MPLLIDLIIAIDDARDTRDASLITPEECEARIDNARQEFRRKEQEAWEQQSRQIDTFLSECQPIPPQLSAAIAGKSEEDARQIIEGYEKWGSAFLSLIGSDVNALWKSHWAGK